MRSPFSIALSLALFTASFAAVFAGCGGSREGTASDAGINSDALCSISTPASCPTPAPVYADVKPIFDQRCVTCHNDEPNSPWSLNDYNHIADWQEVVSQMIADCQMPPADAGIPMTVEEREKILTWIQCGVRR